LSLGNDGKETLHSYFAAAGSGVSDVKQAIYGVRDDAPWTVSTLIMKILGLVMSTSSGLCVGKEGPYVHLAASAANLVNQSVPARLRISARKALSIGSAAGMAVAFGTPMTGAAFVIEDFG
jgi:chloride channel 3/4/5